MRPRPMEGQTRKCSASFHSMLRLIRPRPIVQCLGPRKDLRRLFGPRLWYIRTMNDIQSNQPFTMGEGDQLFPFVSDTDTCEAVRESRVVFVLRGPPGSGKSTLAKRIHDAYGDISTLLSADDEGLQPTCAPYSDQADYDTHAGFHTKVVIQCKESTKIIIVDDTNHDDFQFQRLFNIARKFSYMGMLVEPHKPWMPNPREFHQHSHWHFTEDELLKFKAKTEEPVIALFYGWFLTKKSVDFLLNHYKSFLEDLHERPQFLEEFSPYMLQDIPLGDQKQPPILDMYFSRSKFSGGRDLLHCTANFTDYGQTPGAATYVKSSVVEQSLGRAFKLQLTALFVTPRTVGARVELSRAQLPLFDFEESVSDPTTADPVSPGPGSRAHVTLGCAPNVEPVQTGLDLMDILRSVEADEKPRIRLNMHLGELCCYGEGRWMLDLTNPIPVNSLFSGLYAKSPPDDDPASHTSCEEESS
uniref:2',3'-cyclic-nucleotide 3'-phosphodiesterase isoform X1 n=2 Tax=Myxine glutinosa TaxID=7769 RepID=UPI00358F24FC